MEDPKATAQLPVWIDERGERWVEVDGYWFSIGWEADAR